jgi:hypothetical protein
LGLEWGGVVGPPNPQAMVKRFASAARIDISTPFLVLSTHLKV